MIIWTQGGLLDPSFGWITIVPIAAAVINGNRDAWFWVSASVLLAVALYAATLFGIQPVNIIEPEFRAFAHMSFHIAFVLIIGILTSSWLTRQRLLEEELNQSLRDTADEALNAQLFADAATAANEGAAFATAVQDCMSIVCIALGWETGQLWIRNDDGSMVPTTITTKDIDPVYAPLIQNADEIGSLSHNCLPRLVAETGDGIARTDLVGDSREAHGEAIGLEAVLIWPLLVDGQVDAILEFFSRKHLKLDERTRRLLNHVALQLAHVRGREMSRGKMEQLAYYDIVTGLPNRHAFERRIESILETAARRQRRVALMFIDLDGFKHVNDSLGHAAGDILLHRIGERLSDNLRSSDITMKLTAPDATMVARLGGDEFTVVLQDLAELRGAETVARRFVDIISQAIEIDGHEVFVGVSIGIAVYPDDATEPSDLLRLADAAMYEAKHTTGSQYRFATEALNKSVQRRSWLEKELRRAVATEAMGVFYQPIVDARSNQILAFEALARWRHKGEWIEPSEFIRLAEETGVIYGLGDIVLRQACTEIAAHNKSNNSDLYVCVNVSAHQLRHDQFLDNLVAILGETKCNAAWLVLELTETSLLIDDAASIDILTRLGDLGLKIALDDFGTGYASLSYLRQFPLHYVKIDESFVSGIGNKEDEAIIQAITSMAHTLGLVIVAEGIETESQAEKIRELGCDSLQGFLFGRPRAQMVP